MDLVVEDVGYFLVVQVLELEPAVCDVSPPTVQQETEEDRILHPRREVERIRQEFTRSLK